MSELRRIVYAYREHGSVTRFRNELAKWVENASAEDIRKLCTGIINADYNLGGDYHD